MARRVPIAAELGCGRSQTADGDVGGGPTFTCQFHFGASFGGPWPLPLAARPRNNVLRENRLQKRQLFRLLSYWSLLVANAIRLWRFSSPKSNPRTGC